jgi:hypothetical protein
MGGQEVFIEKSKMYKKIHMWQYMMWKPKLNRQKILVFFRSFFFCFLDIFVDIFMEIVREAVEKRLQVQG